MTRFTVVVCALGAFSAPAIGEISIIDELRRIDASGVVEEASLPPVVQTLSATASGPGPFDRSLFAQAVAPFGNATAWAYQYTALYANRILSTAILSAETSTFGTATTGSSSAASVFWANFTVETESWWHLDAAAEVLRSGPQGGGGTAGVAMQMRVAGAETPFFALIVAPSSPDSFSAPLLLGPGTYSLSIEAYATKVGAGDLIGSGLTTSYTFNMFQVPSPGAVALFGTAIGVGFRRRRA